MIDGKSFFVKEYLVKPEQAKWLIEMLTGIKELKKDGYLLLASPNENILRVHVGVKVTLH